MVDTPLPGDIEDPGRIFPTKPIGPEDQQKMPLPSTPFSSYMQKAAKPETQTPSHLTPLAIMQGSTPAVTAPNPDALLQQVTKLQATSNQLQNYLQTPNLKLKASDKYLLKNKLSESNEHLTAFNTKLGTPLSQEAKTPPLTGPLGKFLGYLTSGQQMLGAAKMQLEKIKATGTHMTPGDFLLVQLKLNKAQQLLEFSSVLLSNAVSDIKQFMQIQL